MIFGKHINRYYLKYGYLILAGIITLLFEDYIMLLVPNMYQQVLNGINDGFVTVSGVSYVFDMDYLLDKICIPLVFIILAMTVGRFLWRVLFFGAAVRTETDLRERMFDRARYLSCRFYGRNHLRIQ